jgi:2-polyprenyl-3-methyl-5-hydroxy-6-metoxy-1,4-benzoquinol methylase
MAVTAPAITRAREDHPEILDDRTLDPGLVERSMRDVVRSNTFLGGTRAVVREINRVLGELPRSATLLDVGTGMGDIPAAAQQSARRLGTALFTVGVDVSQNLTRVSRRHLNAVVCADAAALPFRAKSIDVVCCSQLVHHFESATAARIIQEMDRVARHTVIISDIRRSRLAAAGIWVTSFALRFHPVSRHDGVASVRRGFDREQLRSLVLRSTGVDPDVRRHAGFRMTARWRPRDSTGGHRHHT